LRNAKRAGADEAAAKNFIAKNRKGKGRRDVIWKVGKLGSEARNSRARGLTLGHVLTLSAAVNAIARERRCHNDDTSRCSPSCRV